MNYSHLLIALCVLYATGCRHDGDLKPWICGTVPNTWTVPVYLERFEHGQYLVVDSAGPGSSGRFCFTAPADTQAFYAVRSMDMGRIAFVAGERNVFLHIRGLEDGPVVDVRSVPASTDLYPVQWLFNKVDPPEHH